MDWYTALLFVGFVLVQRTLCNCDNAPGPKIAIIGAGIGGAATAHFLTKLFDHNLEIDIFEEDQIGGRLATVPLGSSLYEAGGSVIHPRNKYMKDFVKELDLKTNPTSRKMKFAIWDGTNFKFRGGDAGSMEAEYDKGNVSKLFRTVNSFLDNFGNIYKAQEHGLAYENVNDLISAMNPNFPKLLQLSAAEYFRSLGLSDRIINELIQAIMIENYGQNIADVHSFVGLVSVAGAGATEGGGLWSVRGGNSQVGNTELYFTLRGAIHLVPGNLILRLDPQVTLKFLSQVKKIRYFLNEDFQTQYEIQYYEQGTRLMTNVYDVVVIAAPMTATQQKKKIKLVGFLENINQLIPGNYKSNEKTFVQGDINPIHFLTTELEDTIGTILSYDPNQTQFNSISRPIPAVNGSTEIQSKVWKISSAYSFPYYQIRSIFSGIHSHGYSIRWEAAYPEYSTFPRKDKFELYDSLYHVNAIEWAASAMEMSAIGGRNVAILIRKKFLSCCKD